MEFTSIYGIIKINEDYDKSVRYLKSLGKDKTFPFINSNMFSYGDYEIPYYYADMVLGFAATYKYFGLDLEDWNLFIFKIEQILKEIDFESAQFHCDGALGSYTLYWEKAPRLSYLSFGSEEEYMEKLKLVKHENWYFGFGKRCVFTGLLDDTYHYRDLRTHGNIGFTYPVVMEKK